MNADKAKKSSNLKNEKCIHENIDMNKDVKSVIGINIVEVANEENISKKKKEDKVNKKNDEIDVVDLAKENVLSKVADELDVR